MPGITGFTSTSTNVENGALNQIEIEIKVNTLEDLNIIDKLYFKPGFDLLIEYGANAYLDDEGDIQGQIYSVSKKFLKGEDLLKIQQKTREYKDKTGGNYQALFGKVINFSWDYNLDGSYDCKVKLISKGELMESLEALLFLNDSSPIKNDAREKALVGDIANVEETVDVNDVISSLLIALKWNSKSERNRLKKKYGVDIFRSIELKADKVQGDNVVAIPSVSNSNAYHWYITLRDFLHLLDTKFLQTGSEKDGKPFSLSTDYSKTDFTTFHEHMSVPVKLGTLIRILGIGVIVFTITFHMQEHYLQKCL